APAAAAAASGGDFQVPEWFEAAARKMLAERGGDQGLGLPELTLIGAAASSSTTRLAAKSVGEAAAASTITSTAAPGPAPSAKEEDDIEDLAHEIWEEIQRLKEWARKRNGE